MIEKLVYYVISPICNYSRIKLDYCVLVVVPFLGKHLNDNGCINIEAFKYYLLMFYTIMDYNGEFLLTSSKAFTIISYC